MHVAIAGNIGSGKTTLTRLMSKQFGWKPHYEDVENNPYLHSFYDLKCRICNEGFTLNRTEKILLGDGIFTIL